jgi:aspartate racemase
MKTIGILGGMGPESTVTYYEYITQTYYRRFGNYAFPEIVIYSVRFQEFVDLFTEGKWEIVSDKAVQGLERLRKAGANFGIMATNTLHAAFDRIQEKSPLPIISIMEPVVEAIKVEGMHCVGLLATIFTMKNRFYFDRLAKEGIKALVPTEEDQQTIQKIIVSELTMGQKTAESKEIFLRIIKDLQKAGAQGIILGCTEIPLLLTQQDCALRLFDSTSLHAESALRHATG